MNAQYIAKTIGVDKVIIEELISGRVTISISGEFGATKSALQDFIHGRVRESVSIILGINKNEAQKMRDQIRSGPGHWHDLGLLCSQTFSSKRQMAC